MSKNRPANVRVVVFGLIRVVAVISSQVVGFGVSRREALPLHLGSKAFPGHNVTGGGSLLSRARMDLTEFVASDDG